MVEMTGRRIHLIEPTRGDKKTGSYIVSGEFLAYHRGSSGVWRPPTDVFETEDHIEVRVEIPGVDEDAIKVTFSKNLLRITGKRCDTTPKKAIHQMEIHYGSFVSDVYIGFVVSEDRIEAQYKNGFLHVILPKSEGE